MFQLCQWGSLGTLLFTGILTTNTLPVSAQQSCPREPDSSFCASYRRAVTEERVRKKIFDAAREAGEDNPSGFLWLRRDTAGDVMVEAVDLSLPEEVEARLPEYVAPLLASDCSPSEEGSVASALKRIRDLPPGARACRTALTLLEPGVQLPDPEADNTSTRLKNRGRIQRLLKEVANDRSIQRRLNHGDARAVFWLYVDATGRVRQVSVKNSSGIAHIDRQLADVARKMVFRPALNHGRPMGVWRPLQLSVEHP